MELIKDSMSEGFSIVVSLDSNENMRKEKFQKLFEEIGTIETSKLFSDKSPPTTYQKGRH